MKKLKSWLTRIASAAVLPVLVHGTIAGDALLANLLPFYVWLLFIAYLFVCVMVPIASKDNPEFFAKSAAAGLSPGWFRWIDVVLTSACVTALAAHEWYVTAAALVVTIVFEAVIREHLREGIAAYRAAQLARTLSSYGDAAREAGECVAAFNDALASGIGGAR